MKLPYRTAHSFWTRVRGRLGETQASQPLFIPRCNAVHTFGMRFPLLLTWFDKTQKVIRQEVVQPNRFCFCAGAHSVLESHLDEPAVEIETATNQDSIWRDQSGQALVEAAFTIPILLVIVFGFIQVGLAVHQSQKLTYVSHYATQVGSITNDPDKISGAIEEFFAPDQYELTIESFDDEQTPLADADRQHNDILTVQITHPFSLQIPLVSISVMNLSATASARVLCTNPSAPYTCNS